MALADRTNDQPPARRERDAYWRSVFEHSPEGMLYTAPDGRILAANPAACAMLGRSEREVCEAGRAGVVVADERARALLAERERAGHARGLLTLRRGDGTTFLAEVSSAIFVEPDGAVRTSMSFRDVTERERARRALEILTEAGRVFGSSLDIEATLTHLTALVVPMLADVCTVDLIEGGQVKRVAASHRDPSRVKAFIGVRRPTLTEGALGGVDLVLATGAPSALFQVTDEWLKAVTQDEAHFQAAKALGIRSFVATPLVAHGRTIGALTLMSDGGVPAFSEADVSLVKAISDRAAVAIANAREHRDALEARRLRDEVLGIVAHDLRNPLNTILLSASALALQAQSPHLEAIRRAVRRADQLVGDLLTAATAEAGVLVLDRREESVASVLAEVVELHRAVADALAISLEVKGSGGQGAFNVDRHRVVQLLSNLVGNALKFTPPGGRVELRAEADGQGVVLTVADNGPGIASRDLPHLFDRFWQGAHKREGGVGLGLAIARSIAEAHGGSIAVDSVEGQGSTFTVVLP